MAGQRELSGTSGNKLTGAVANRHIPAAPVLDTL